MKTITLILAALILGSFSASADNFRKLKFTNSLGRTIEFFVKNEVEVEVETYEINTAEIFREIKFSRKEMIDITPFIIPEKEVEENLPVYVE
jgi:hypothetical protein